MVSTAPTAYKFSGEDPNTGYWTFIVDLSDGTGVVTEMKSMASTPAKTSSDAKLRLYPASISDEEAVAVGRVTSRGTGIGFRREVEMELSSEYEDY